MTIVSDQSSTPEVPLEIDVQAVKELMDAEADFLLLDCREQNEYDFARIEQATLIPMQQIPQRENELSEYRDKQVVVMCHLGGRSLRVTHWLRENGFRAAQNMVGGINAWSETIDPSVPTY